MNASLSSEFQNQVTESYFKQSGSTSQKRLIMKKSVGDKKGFNARMEKILSDSKTRVVSAQTSTVFAKSSKQKSKSPKDTPEKKGSK